MTVKELKEEISGFKDDSQVLISDVFYGVDDNGDEVIQNPGISVFEDELYYIGEVSLVEETDDNDFVLLSAEDSYCREEHVSRIKDI